MTSNMVCIYNGSYSTKTGQALISGLLKTGNQHDILEKELFRVNLSC